MEIKRQNIVMIRLSQKDYSTELMRLCSEKGNVSTEIIKRLVKVTNNVHR